MRSYAKLSSSRLGTSRHPTRGISSSSVVPAPVDPEVEVEVEDEEEDEVYDEVELP